MLTTPNLVIHTHTKKQKIPTITFSVYVLHLRESNFISVQDPRFSIGRYKRYTPGCMVICLMDALSSF